MTLGRVLTRTSKNLPRELKPRVTTNSIDMRSADRRCASSWRLSRESGKVWLNAIDTLLGSLTAALGAGSIAGEFKKAIEDLLGELEEDEEAT